jgi:IS5 family transposase
MVMQKEFTTQPPLFVSTANLDHPILHGLDASEAMIDWSDLERLMASIYGAKTGRPSYPLLTLFRSLLLGICYRLSDEQLAQCLFRDLLFRRFCRLELDGTAPDSSTICRFRNALVAHDLWELLLAEVNRQLEAKHIIITEGRVNIIDATAVEAAQSGAGKAKDCGPTRDEDAGWHVKADIRFFVTHWCR